jgi:glc operon protein GlcG
MKSIRNLLMAAAALACICSIAPAQQAAPRPQTAAHAHGLPLGQVRPMTVALAKQIVAAAKRAACQPPAGDCSGAFAVVDDAGSLVYFEIIDGVLADGPDLAIRKAKTSALWRRPTETFLNAVDNKSNTSYAGGTFQDMTTSPGGLPLVKDGRIVGGFGSAAVGTRGAIKQINAAVMAEATKLFGPQ